jgi:threonine dehydrogenase-like Zn-dependent dehydrogenase
MRAVRSIHGEPTLVDVDEPSGDWPVLEVGAVGICGSDLALLSWGLPATIGHELAGTIDGTGYCVEPTMRCGTCDQCLVGAPQRCRNQRLLGVTMDGGLADRVAVQPECLVPLPDGLPVANASLVEPLAVSWHALRRVSAVAGERVLVVGGGSIGLLAVAAAKAMGLDVDLEARHPHQKAAGERLGAGNPNGEYEVVVESAGTESSLATCISHAAPAGRVALVGVAHDNLALPGVPVMMKELTLVGCMCYDCGHGGNEFAQAAEVLAADPEIAATIVTHRFPLADVREAFRVAQDRGSGAIKVVVEP